MFEQRRDFVLALTVDCGIAYLDLFGMDESRNYMSSKNVPNKIICDVLSGLCHPRRISLSSLQLSPTSQI